tara:strand:- start:108 stop:608 length:501 start_codon:yes stop_codon:yes gene_type:complete
MKTTQELYLKLRSLADTAHDVYKKRGHSPEYRELHKKFAEFRDNIDPNLSSVIKTAKGWLRDNHTYVYFNSSWSNCYSLDNAMHEYLGFSAYHRKPKEGIPFDTTSVTPKEMILDGFKYYKAQLNQEMDILAAGDVDTNHLTHTDEKIMLMLKDVENFDDNLMERK